jgi:hypothetical protein
MSIKAYSIPAIQRGFSPRADGSYTLRFHTQEMDKAHGAEIFMQTGIYGSLTFIPEGSTDPPLIDTSSVDPQEKWTPSQRLRFAIIENCQTEDTEEYYKKVMQKFIDHVNMRTKEGKPLVN